MAELPDDDPIAQMEKKLEKMPAPATPQVPEEEERKHSRFFHEKTGLDIDIETYITVLAFIMAGAFAQQYAAKEFGIVFHFFPHLFTALALWYEKYSRDEIVLVIAFMLIGPFALSFLGYNVPLWLWAFVGIFLCRKIL